MTVTSTSDNEVNVTTSDNEDCSIYPDHPHPQLLVDLLQSVTNNKSSLMDAHNIGVVFAPVLLKPQDIETAAR